MQQTGIHTYGEKIPAILKGILGTVGGDAGPAEIWYRVRTDIGKYGAFMAPGCGWVLFSLGGRNPHKSVVQ